MTVEELLPRLDSVRRRSRGHVARCPAHADKSPSLAIKEGERGLLIRCWAGCTLDEITAALGIKIKDLFFDAPSRHGSHRPTTKPVKTDLAALAFRLKLGALDRRLRAEHVFSMVISISIKELPDNDWDRLLDAVGRAYADIDRAELLEMVADDLRVKEFAQRERTVRHAA